MRKQMNKRFGFSKVKAMVAAAAVAACLGGVSSANAARVDLTDRDTGVSPVGVDVWVDVIDSGSTFDFIFHNDSAVGSVTSVYFEIGYRDWSVFAKGGSNRSAIGSAGVDFGIGATTTLTSWNNAFSYGAANTSDGIDSSTELLTVSVKKADNSLGIDDILPLLASNGTRIAAYVDLGQGGLDVATGSQSQLGQIEPLPTTPGEADPGNNGSGTQNPVAAPLPAAIWPGVALLGGALLRRRRQEKA